MLEKFYDLNIKLQDIAELKVILQSMWENMPDETMRNLSKAFSDDWPHVLKYKTDMSDTRINVQ